MKTSKILILLTAICAIIAISSCTKDKKTPTPSITLVATINDTLSNFITGAIAIKGTIGDTPVTSIQGTSKDGTLLSITLSGTVTAGKTYSNTAADDNDKPLILLSSEDHDTFVNDDGSVNNQVSVTITAVTSTSVQGTFKGDLIKIGDDGSKKVVTNGKFYVLYSTGNQL